MIAGMGHTIRSITFCCQGDELFGVIHEPDLKPNEIGVVIIVGGPQYRVGSHRQFVLTARSLAAAGYPVMRFDVRGMGDSEGSSRDFLQIKDDIAAAIDAFLDEVPSVRHICLYGLCDGASAAVLYGHTDPRVKALVLVNPWVRTEIGEAKTVLQHYYWQRIRQKKFWDKLFSSSFGWRASIGGLLQNFARARRGGDALMSANSGAGEDYVDEMAGALWQFVGQTLILLSDNDLTAREFETVCNARLGWSNAVGRTKARIQPIVDADHTFSARAAREKADNVVLQWLGSLQVFP